MQRDDLLHDPRLNLYALGMDLSKVKAAGMMAATTTNNNAQPQQQPQQQQPNNQLATRLKELEAQVTAQGMLVRTLKKEGKPFDNEVQTLTKLKVERDAVQKELSSGDVKFDIDGLLNVLTRRMIVVPAFEIHGSVGGLMDFGPPGVGLKDNIVDVWKRHFIVREGMLAVETTNLTPHSVLQASGHVARFNDLLVEEMNDDGTPTGEFHRADKLLEGHCEMLLEKGELNPAEADRIRKLANGADSLTVEEMDRTLKEMKVRGNPPKNLALSYPRPFNLMFATTIGPSGLAKAYLRPETAQGIFVNFKKLLEYNNQKMPFAAATVGTGFRNEISPKGGLIRVREFTMAEIEHFVHPKHKNHARFDEVANVVLQLFTAKAQITTFDMEHMTARQAVECGAINNETLAYYMARSQQFFIKIGIDPKRLRFRQHLPTEMAHYASDCYDAEVLLNQGWLECAGHADRACYDLEAHTKATKIELVASEKLDVPLVEKVVTLEPNKGMIGAQFRKDAGHVMAALVAMTNEEAEKAEAQLNSAAKKCAIKGTDGKEYVITRDMAKLLRTERKVYDEKFYPAVIEPSFGIGRIVYAVLEHSYWIRSEASAEEAEDPADRDLGKVVRNVLAINPLVAPFKAGIIVTGGVTDVALGKKLVTEFQEAGISAYMDSSAASIGKKYARFDEVGVPFCITLDDETSTNGSVTIRERDTEEQVRIPKSEDFKKLIKALVESLDSWQGMRTRFKIVRAATNGRR